MKAADLHLEDLHRHDPSPYRSSGQIRFACPYCGSGKGRDNSHRSLVVDEMSGVWICHRCNQSGLLGEFRSTAANTRVGGLQYQAASPQALCTTKKLEADDQQATERLQRQLRTVWPVFPGTPADDYLQSRGIPTGLADRCFAKFSPTWGATDRWGGTPSVVFPVLEWTGKLVAASGRSVSGSEKLTFGPKKLGVFGTPGACKAPVLAITEAPIDAMSLALCDIPAIALLGTSVADWLPQRLAFKTVLIATDADEPGDAAARTVLKTVGPFARCYRLRPPAKDWNAFLMAEGEEYVRALLSGLVDDCGLGDKLN